MQHLILLHGAIGHSKQLGKTAAAFGNEGYTIHTPGFSGHGGKPFPGGAFSIQLFASEVLAYMDDRNIEKAIFFGYSMGGYVAMYLAQHHPQRVGKIITLATKFHWDVPTAEKECKMLDSAKISEKLPAFAQYLSDSHSPNDWKEVLKRTQDMLLEMGKDNPLALPDYAAIKIPVLLLLGDRDKMVTLDETVAVYKVLPAAQMGVLPGTPHPIEQVDNILLKAMINPFLEG